MSPHDSLDVHDAVQAFCLAGLERNPIADEEKALQSLRADCRSRYLSSTANISIYVPTCPVNIVSK